ncbi:MAG: NADPH:quinone reductase [Icmadophila ericetorum]|nr:NADPH:quinone reductase [Icmadophila ericetorum]
MASTTAQIPKTMKGVLIEKTGGVEVLQYRTDLPVPEPKEGEILVKNDYIGINYIDTYFRTGLYPSPKPEILGREAEGHILSLGPGTHPPSLKEGTRVVYMGTSSYAEYTATSSAKAYAIPSSIPETHACASILQGLTALTLVEEAHRVEKGDVVLVHAAAGGVGLWLCQILRAKGVKVIATASTEAKRKLAKENGADVCVGYGDEEVKEAVKKETHGGEGVVAVFDSVGKSTFEGSLEAVRRKGSMVSFGNASGAVPPFAISRLSAKNVRIARPTLFNYIYTREEFEKYTDELFQMMASGKFNVRIHEIYPLEDVARAHTDLEGRKTTGKLLMKP